MEYLVLLGQLRSSMVPRGDYAVVARGKDAEVSLGMPATKRTR